MESILKQRYNSIVKVYSSFSRLLCHNEVPLVKFKCLKHIEMRLKSVLLNMLQLHMCYLVLIMVIHIEGNCKIYSLCYPFGLYHAFSQFFNIGIIIKLFLFHSL